MSANLASVFEVLLEKRSRGRMLTMSRTWALRTIRLSRQTLSYYDGNDLKGSVDIAGSTLRTMTPGEADNKSFPFEIDTGSEKLLFNASCAETRSKCVEIFSLASKTATWDEIQAAQLKQLDKTSSASSQFEEKNQQLVDERKALEKERMQVKKEKFEMERKVMLEAKNKRDKEKIQFLRQGMALPQNGYLQSHNGVYYALMQADGNFVVYVSRHAVPANAIWSTNTGSDEGEGPYCLTLSDDGRLSLLDVTCNERWTSTSNVIGVPDFCLKLEDDGNLVLRDGNSHIVWQSSTSRGDSSLLLPI